jgi:hypothetical protein
MPCAVQTLWICFGVSSFGQIPGPLSSIVSGLPTIELR